MNKDLVTRVIIVVIALGVTGVAVYRSMEKSDKNEVSVTKEEFKQIADTVRAKAAEECKRAGGVFGVGVDVTYDNGKVVISTMNYCFEKQGRTI